MSDFRVDGSLGADVAAFVRSIQTARSELQGLKDDVADLNRELRELENKTVKVKVEIDGQAEIRQLRDDLDRLSRETVKIKVEVEIDAASIDEVRADLRYIRDTADTRINIRVDVDGMAEVERLHLMLMELRGRHRVTIDVDTDGLADLAAHLIIIRGLLNTLGDSENAVGEGAGAASGGMGGMMGIIMMLMPAVVALGAVLAGVAAGLVGAFATMGVGLGAFAVFAMPTFKKITEAASGTKEEFDKLSPPMQRAVTNLKDLKSRFSELQKELEPTALGVFAEALNFARAGMEQLFKAAKPAGQAIQGLLKDAAEGLMGDRWTKFFDYIAKNVGYFITNWGHAIGNFVTGIANMIVAFDPLSKFVTKGFLGMSESFLKWTDSLANSPQFQQFVDFVIKNGPLVLSMIGSLVTSLFQIGVAMAPAGAGMLGFIAQLLASVAAFLQANPQFAQLLAYLIPLVGAAMTLGPLISTLAGALLGLSGPALLVVAAIAAVVAIVLVWWTQCATFRDFVKELFAEIWASIKGWIDQIKEMFQDWLPAIVELWNKYGESIKNYVMGLWKVISAVISGALQAIRGIVNIILGLLTGDWSRVWKGIQQVLGGVWTAIKGIVSGGAQALKGLLQGLLTAIGNIFKGVGNLLYNAGRAIVKGLWDGIQSMWGWVTSQFSSKLSSLRDMLPFSPAKKGPFSGKGWTLYSGMSIAQSLGDGFASKIPGVQAQLAMKLADMKSGLNTNVASAVQPKTTAAGVLAGAAAGGQINFAEGAFKIFNPAPETPSDTVNRTMTRVSRFGIFEGVGAA
jgi:phage-related protein